MVNAGSNRFSQQRAVLYCIGITACFFIAMWALWRIPNQFWGMYGNMDGMWAAWNAKAIIDWGYPFDFSPYNILSGMGSMYAPNLPWLNPGALALGLPFDAGANYVVSYAIYLLEILVSLIVLMRVVGLSPVRSVIVAQVYVLFIFPPVSEWFLTLRWYSLAPFNAHLVAMANLVLCLFLRVGDYRLRGNIACIFAALILTFSAISSGPITYLTYAPVYALMALALLPSQPLRSGALLWKLGFLAVLITLAWGIGLPEYLSATRELSARTENLTAGPAISSIATLAEVLRTAWEKFSLCGKPQELLCAKYPVFWFHFLAVAGAVSTLFMKSSKLKVLAVCFLFYYGLLHAWELAHQVRLFGKLHVISVPFLIWSAYPFFALFFTLLFFSPYDYFHNKLSTTRTAKLSPGSSELPLRGFAVIATTLLALLIPLYMYYMWKRNIEQFQPPKQSKTRNSVLGISPVRAPAVGAIARYLIEHASITPGHVFRGYTVSYFGDPAGHLRKSLDVPQTGMGWRVHVHSRPYLEAHYNNSFQEMDLWQFGIPTVEEYGQWVTKQAHFFAAHLFSSPTDAQNGAMLQIYKLNLDLLRVTGVHFVITDLELADPRLTLRARQESPTAGPIQLYEIANPNLATYSPTDITQVRTFDAAMRFLQQGSPTLEKRVSTFDAMRGPFTQISQAIMLAERDGFRVTAKSEGRSLLLLPVQYSRCLHIDHADAMDTQSSARLVRANGIQTLLAFKRHVDVRIRFNFGLFGTAQCRLQDLQDLRTIGLPD